MINNTNEICPTCGRMLPLCPFATTAQDESGHKYIAWVLAHFCGVCHQWGTKLKGTWPTFDKAEAALLSRRTGSAGA